VTKVTVAAPKRLGAIAPIGHKKTKDLNLLRRQEKCREAVLWRVATVTAGGPRSETVFFAIPKQYGCLFFKACVTLRRILAARKGPIVRRIRKAALLAAIWFAGAGGLMGEEMSAPLTELIKPIHQLGTAISPPAGELPPDVAQVRFANAPLIAAESYGGRGWMAYTYFWQAPALCHRPVYFEEPNLERYGYNAGCLLQPFVSGAHFFSAVPALPVRMALERPHVGRYTLGYARPGSAPCWARPQ
jgi:hypothetical protein